MNSNFKDHIDQLPGQLRELVQSAPASFPLPEAPGIYVLSEAERHLYVGRTNNVRRRIKNHTRPSSGHNQATFAFRLARQATGRKEAEYSSTGSRQALLCDPAFAAAFEAAKARVRQMQVRFLQVAHPIQQALLEIYAAISLATPYNDFDTH